MQQTLKFIPCFDGPNPAYTVPAGKSAVLVSLLATNKYSSNQYATLSIKPSAGVKAATAENIQLTSGASINLLAGKVSLAAGDSVYFERGRSSYQPFLLKNVVSDTALTFSGAAVALHDGATRIAALGATSAGAFVMCTSDDGGATWVNRGTFGTQGLLKGGFYAGGKYIWWGAAVSGQPGLYHSPNGERLFRSIPAMTGVCVGNGKFVGVDCNTSSSCSHTSTDGINYSFGPNSTGVGSGPAVGKQVAFGAGIFARVSASLTNMAWYGADGENWVSAGNGGAVVGRSMSFAGGLFFLGCNSGTTLYTSPDAKVWIARTTPAAQVSAVASGAGVYVAATEVSQNLYSVNLDVWSATTTTGLNHRDVTYGRGLFVGVGAGGAIHTSVNGDVWAARASSTAYQLNSVADNGLMFVAVGANGTIVTSPDATTPWTARASNTTSNLLNVAWNDAKSLWLAVSQYGQVTSADGINWVARGLQGTSTITSITHGATDGSNYVFTAGTTSITTSASYGVFAHRTVGVSMGPIAFGGGKWVGYRSDGTGGGYSTDMANWTALALPGVMTYATSVVCVVGVFYLTGASTSLIYKSSDPTTGWQSTGYGVSGSGKLWAANGYVFTYGNSTDMFSTDGFATTALTAIFDSTSPIQPLYIGGDTVMHVYNDDVRTVELPTGTNSYLLSGALSVMEIN